MTTEPPPVPLLGGPGHAATIPDPGRERIYVAMTGGGDGLTALLDRHGQAMALPDDQGAATEALLNEAANRWELYQRQETDDAAMYVWVEP